MTTARDHLHADVRAPAMSETLLPRIADSGDDQGTRRRSAAHHPVLSGFHPDPTVCRVGSDYYLVNSSFEYFPGAPIFHSRDLISWSQIGNILNRRSQFRTGDGRDSAGIYAGTLRHHDGRFWFITTNVSDFGGGQLIVHADDPTGPWSEPIHVAGAVGIDPDICWDEDGQCYLTWNALTFTEEPQQILQVPIDLATGTVTGVPYPVWQGSGLAAAEGPHLYRVGAYWFLVLAEGGTERGHCVTIARSHAPYGPFESCPANPVFTHRSTIHPVQNIGHADLVETDNGDWAAVYLGARPRGSTPGYHVLGRETFLAGINWVDSWPVFDEHRYETVESVTDFTDDFTERLHDRWVVPGGEPQAIAARGKDGGVVIQPRPDGSPGLLCARVRDHQWTAEATVETAGRLLLRSDDRHWYGVVLERGSVRAVTVVGGITHEFEPQPVRMGKIVLRIQCVPAASAPVPLGTGGPDDIVLSAHDADGNYPLARLDGRYLSTEVAAGFTGRMLALASSTGGSHVKAIRYAATDSR